MKSANKLSTTHTLSKKSASNTHSPVPSVTTNKRGNLEAGEKRNKYQKRETLPSNDKKAEKLKEEAQKRTLA